MDTEAYTNQSNSPIELIDQSNFNSVEKINHSVALYKAYPSTQNSMTTPMQLTPKTSRKKIYRGSKHIMQSMGERSNFRSPQEYHVKPKMPKGMKSLNIKHTSRSRRTKKNMFNSIFLDDETLHMLRLKKNSIETPVVNLKKD
jgi:hypothetical protein